MRRIFRTLSVLLSAALIMGSVGGVNAFADESKGRIANTPKNLTGLTVTGFNAPTGGVPFAKGVTITSAEGFSWDIPVVWNDASGKTVTVPEPGKIYFPTFVLYVPGGYKLGDVDAAGHIIVRFPALLSPDGLVYMVDPATGITYITYAKGLIAPGPGGSYTTKSGDKAADKDKENKGSDDADEDDDDDDDDDDIPEEIRKFCDDTAINAIYWQEPEFLSWLIGVIRDSIQPQAVQLLIDGFDDSFGKARDEELTDSMGLYIYFETGSLDGDPTPEGALGYVSGFYDNNKEYVVYMGIDANQYVTFNAQTGKYEIIDTKRDDFTNTVVHEMMHGIMDDYTRYGMSGQTDQSAFPNWFIEGIATTVENAYQYRNATFMELYNEDERAYTTGSIKDRYTTTSADGEEFDIKYSASQNNGASAYVMGSVATVYLGYLYSKNILNQDPIDANGNVNISYIRDGVDHILLDLHGTTPNGSDAQSLDTIIKKLSNEQYANTKAFQDNFIKGDTEGQAGGSLWFTEQYLNWMKGQGYDDGEKHMEANGSILRDEQNYSDPIPDWGIKPEGLPYQIADQRPPVKTSTDDVRANTTGGTSEVGQGSPAIQPEGADQQAAKTKLTAADLMNTLVLPTDTAQSVTDTDSSAPAVVTPPATETSTDEPSSTPAATSDSSSSESSSSAQSHSDQASEESKADQASEKSKADPASVNNATAPSSVTEATPADKGDKATAPAATTQAAPAATTQAAPAATTQAAPAATTQAAPATAAPAVTTQTSDQVQKPAA